MNEEFLERIKSYIPDEFDVFLASLDKPLYRGLRVNTKKDRYRYIERIYACIR